MGFACLQRLRRDAPLRVDSIDDHDHDLFESVSVIGHTREQTVLAIVNDANDLSETMFKYMGLSYKMTRDFRLHHFNFILCEIIAKKEAGERKRRNSAVSSAYMASPHFRILPSFPSEDDQVALGMLDEVGDAVGRSESQHSELRSRIPTFHSPPEESEYKTPMGDVETGQV